MIQTNKKYNNLVKGLQKEFSQESRDAVIQGYKKEIKYVLKDRPEWGLKPGYCIFSW